MCVRSRDGRPTSGLKPEDFLILENNTPQQIALFSAEGRVRLAVALLVDNSASMAGPRLERARGAAAEFLGILRSDDLVEVISFNERANLGYPLGTDHKQAKVSLNEIEPGQGRLIEIQGKQIALFNVDGQFFALDNACTHRGGPLAEGAISGHEVTCPWHGVTYDVETGEVLGPPAHQRVARYGVRVMGIDIEVEV